MRILLAPDKFKGTLTARQAVQALVRGWTRVRPDDVLDEAPMADGGEGTLEVLVPADGSADGGRIVARRVSGPLGDPTDAVFGLRGTTGVVEMARASGLALLGPDRRDPRRASTRGTGELMRSALGEGVDRLLVSIGGSATNDGGSGMARALGARFLDASGNEIAEGGAALLDLAAIDTRGLDPRLQRTSVTVLADVDNPLCGPSGASAVYGPQKGATPDDVALLDAALGHLAAVVHRDLGIDLGDEPGAGAAGGLGFGLMAFCGARLRPGVQVVIDAQDLERRADAADLIVTGEGSFDEQSMRGKVPDGVRRVAELAGVPLIVVCGVASVPAPPGVTLRSLMDRVGASAAIDDPRRSLELVAEELADEAEAILASAGGSRGSS